jgi:hypothetical protein
MIYRKNKKTLSTEKLLNEMHLQWRFAGGKSKEDKDSANEDEILLIAMYTKKGGKKPNGRGNPKKENPNKDKICDHCNKKGILRTRAGRSTLRKSQSLQRIEKASKQTAVPLQQLRLMIAKKNHFCSNESWRAICVS